jgi:hypothetical protein
VTVVPATAEARLVPGTCTRFRTRWRTGDPPVGYVRPRCCPASRRARSVELAHISPVTRAELSQRFLSLCAARGGWRSEEGGDAGDRLLCGRYAREYYSSSCRSRGGARGCRRAGAGTTDRGDRSEPRLEPGRAGRRGRGARRGCARRRWWRWVPCSGRGGFAGARAPLGVHPCRHTQPLCARPGSGQARLGRRARRVHRWGRAPDRPRAGEWPLVPQQCFTRDLRRCRAATLVPRRESANAAGDRTSRARAEPGAARTAPRGRCGHRAHAPSARAHLQQPLRAGSTGRDRHAPNPRQRPAGDHRP